MINLVIEKYYRNLPDNIKDSACVINLDEHSDIGTHWIALYAINNNVTYFDSFGVEHISKEMKKIILDLLMRFNRLY